MENTRIFIVGLCLRRFRLEIQDYLQSVREPEYFVLQAELLLLSQLIAVKRLSHPNRTSFTKPVTFLPTLKTFL
jgi:hypothetical protein